MKKALRILALLMAIGMILGVLCSCGGGGETSESVSESVSDSESQGGDSQSQGGDSQSQSGESVPDSESVSDSESESIDTTPSIEVDTDGVETGGEWTDPTN